MPYKNEDSHLVDIFIKNLILEMSFQMKMASPEDFAILFKKGKSVENGILEKGSIKHYISSSSTSEPNHNAKPKLWSKNKGITHNGVTNVKSVQNIQGGNNNNSNYHHQNNNNPKCDTQNQNQNRNQNNQPPHNPT